MTGAGIGSVLFGICLLHSWANSSTHVLYPHEAVYSGGPSMFLRSASKRGLAVVGATTPVFLLATVAFCMGTRPLLSGAVLLGLMAGIRQLERRMWHDEIVVKLGKYVPAAAALLGYVVARGIAELTGQTDEVANAAGWEAGCGVMGGAFFLAGLAKLRESGMSWSKARNQAILIVERSYSGPMPVRALRKWVAASPTLCLAAGLYGFYGEFLGLLFAVSWARWPIAIFSVLLQIGITVLLGYIELEWMLIMVALALLSG